MQEPVPIQDKPKAYSYLRFSTPEQMQGDSFRRQSELAQDYAMKHRLELDEKSFDDFGLSAYSGKNRDTGALKLFMQAVEDGLIAKGSYLLVESLDRISRQSARKASRLLEEICESGITVVTLFDGKQYSQELLDNDPAAFIMVVLLFQRAHEESATKAKRLRAAWESKRQRLAAGEAVRLTSRAPQWLRPSSDGVSFEAIPERAKVVRRIFQMTLDGIGKQSVAEALNTEGVPVFGRGKYWHPSYVDKILSNRATYGTLTPFTCRSERKADRKACDPVENYYPVVIERETFEAVQAIRSSNATRRGRHSSSEVQNILGGLAACPLCGSTMTRVSKNKAKGWVYLACQRARQGAGCKYNSVRYDCIESAVYANAAMLADSCPTDAVQGEEWFQDLLGSTVTKGQEIDRLLSLVESDSVPRGDAMDALLDRLAQRKAELDIIKDKIGEALHGKGMLTDAMMERRAVKLSQAMQDSPDDKTLCNARMRECFSKVVVDFRHDCLVFHWKQGGTTQVKYTPRTAKAG